MEGMGTGADGRAASAPVKAAQNSVGPDLRGLSVQRFISGKPGMFSAVAITGKLLAGYSVLKEQVYPGVVGPSAVVRFIDHPEMATTGRALIEHFNYTGFIEFCFVVEDPTGYAYLLECNARPAPIASLGAYVGVDLCRALFRGLRGDTRPARNALKCGTVIAIFPQEWRRNPGSALLRSEFHDVPWDDPDLLRALVGS
jgi:predicted ATP-grasp superfamily ATP-dependent carboligase